MLVLERKVGEEIVIGDNIVITIVKLLHGKQKVRIGVRAPKEIPVNRREVYDAIHRNDADPDKAAS